MRPFFCLLLGLQYLWCHIRMMLRRQERVFCRMPVELLTRSACQSYCIPNVRVCLYHYLIANDLALLLQVNTDCSFPLWPVLAQE